MCPVVVGLLGQLRALVCSLRTPLLFTSWLRVGKFDKGKRIPPCDRFVRKSQGGKMISLPEPGTRN